MQSHSATLLPFTVTLNGVKGLKSLPPMRLRRSDAGQRKRIGEKSCFGRLVF
jgi:hypothetical protein